MPASTDQKERVVTRLRDYTPPAWTIDEAELVFELDPERTRVASQLKIRRVTAGAERVILHGDKLELERIEIDGKEPEDLVVNEQGLSFVAPSDEFNLHVSNFINPQANTALEGLYVSSGMFCTQNEAQGFRRITYYMDRPDVMASFRTTIIAKKSAYPILLANGNEVHREDLNQGRHSITYDLPYPIPSYLYALVAGDLDCVNDTFTTRSGRRIDLRIYVNRGNADFTSFAMASLKEAMAWDEEVFGLEYDLNQYMIVAVDDFNMGAMENKGLNIFNSSLVLAKPETATDEMFEFIQGVVGHEYFHNWTGNRVTCRDWFQLTLKEGLTVYRDQRFTADMTDRAVKRIKDVLHLREFQFPEDAGPMAHPIQPKSYIEINNFYTMTVYEKGAEVIRMIATLIGEDNFRKGMDLYFERHDGQAVTTEEFVSAMEDAGGVSLAGFRRWYDFHGTPRVVINEEIKDDQLVLTIKQLPARSGDEAADEPLVVPIRVALFDRETSQPISVQASGVNTRPGSSDHEVTLVCDAFEQSARFAIPSGANVVPSVLRDFSAPVLLDYDRPRDAHSFLMANDTDGFQAWEAGQNLARLVMHELLDSIEAQTELKVSTDFLEAFGSLLDSNRDKAWLALALQLPSPSRFTQEQPVARFEDTHQAHRYLQNQLGRIHSSKLSDLYHQLESLSSGSHREARGARKLRNVSLAYLVASDESASAQGIALAVSQRQNARTMTEELAALSLLADSDLPEAEAELEAFYLKWKENALVLDNWFRVQASSRRDDTLARVNQLLEHGSFTIKNPNRVRALIAAFSRNDLHFHSANGSGYEWLSDRIVELDAINPAIAARLTNAFARTRNVDEGRRAVVKRALEKVLAQPSLSNDVYEVAKRCADMISE